MLIVALCLRIVLGKPVLFCQERPGLHGRRFTIFKFRTMRGGEPGAPDELRMTSFGVFLRRASLDELPELWNVLHGEMSRASSAADALLGALFARTDAPVRSLTWNYRMGASKRTQRDLLGRKRMLSCYRDVRERCGREVDQVATYRSGSASAAHDHLRTTCRLVRSEPNHGLTEFA